MGGREERSYNGRGTHVGWKEDGYLVEGVHQYETLLTELAIIKYVERYHLKLDLLTLN